MSNTLRALLLVTALLATIPASAAADYQFVAGQETQGPSDGVCPGIGIVARSGYYRNEVGREPRSNEPFYVEVRLTYFESFDCAAAFTGITMTLPGGVIPAPGRAAACQRFALDTGAPDPRITANCPTTPALIGGSTYSLDPIATNHPEKTAFGRKFWFQGYDTAPNKTFRVMRILVPVQAASQVPSGPVTFQMKRFDAAAPWDSVVNVTTTGGAQPSNGGTFVKPKLSVQTGLGELLTSPIGLQFPFNVTKGSTNYALSEKTVEGTDLTFMPFNSCGEGHTGLPPSLTQDDSYLELLGDFADYLGGAPCDLDPGVQHTTQVCAVGDSGGGVLQGECKQVTYITPGVDVDITIADDPADSRKTVFTPVLRGAWPAGTAKIKLTRPGVAESNITNQMVGARGTGSLTLSAATLSNLASWQTHSVRSCYLANSLEHCGPARTFVPGALTASDPSTAAGTATFAGTTLRTPIAAPLTVQLRLAKSADVAGQSAATLPVAASAVIPATATAGTITAPDLVATGLASSTRYAWAVCVDVGGDATPEDCTTGAGFTSATIPAADTGGSNPNTGAGTPTTGGTPGTGAGPDTTVLPAATVTLAVKAVARRINRRARRLTLGTVACGVVGCAVQATLAGRKLSELRAIAPSLVTLASATRTLQTLKPTKVTVRLSKKLLRKLRSGSRTRKLRVTIAASAAGRSNVSKTGTLKVAPR